MNYKLTLETSDVNELARIIAVIGGGSGAASTMHDIDDDGGPVNTAAPAVDADGVPWDDRIHSSNKQTTEKGVWRKKRGIQDSYYQTVTAELKTRGAVQAGVNSVTAAAPAPAPVMPQPVMPMPTPTPLPTPTPQAAPGPSPFGEFMAKYSAAVNAGKVTQAELMSFINAYGVPDLPTLNTRPDIIQQLTDWMTTNGKL